MITNVQQPQQQVSVRIWGYRKIAQFTLAHEIGHILIHHGSHYCKTECFNTFSTQSDVEQEANAFAKELLLQLATAVNNVYRKLVDPQVWIDNEVEDLKCEEESVYFKTLQQYLTILKFYKD